MLFNTMLPRDCGKFLDLLPDPNNELLYCVHLDGKLSIWWHKDLRHHKLNLFKVLI
ncbi:hypothetical protein RCOM_0534980 [Ricinus communis]|uniref:WDR11 first beta-propeller domain-containing protein n=1 Tax=Ricinus communis TaxID=3988 RepID=B9S6C2_RICCO|nr:hypothetical protein RCOM_0534980 [Ricinus communis]